MELKYESCKNKLEIEFKFLEEVEIKEFENSFEDFEDLFYSGNLLKVVGISGGKSILAFGECFGDKFLLVDKLLEVGDFFIKRYENFVKVSEDCFNKDFIKKIKDICEDKHFKLNIEDFTEITPKKIEEFVNNQVEKLKQEFEEQEQIEFKEKETKGETEKRKKEQFEKESILKIEHNNLEIDKKEIKFKNFNFVLEENVNKLISYEELADMGRHSYSGMLDSIETFLVNKEINYSKFKKEENGNLIKIFDLDFKELKLNDVKILKSKIRFILIRINAKNNTKEQILLWKNLTGMKLDFMSLENIRFLDNHFPLKVKILDKDRFELNFMDKNKVFIWDKIREIFFDNGSSRSCNGYFYYPNEFLEFTDNFEIKKQEVFDYTKKLKMLEKLNGKEKN